MPASLPVRYTRQFSYQSLTNSQTNTQLLAPATAGNRLVIHDIWVSVTAAGLYTVSRGDNGSTSNLFVARIGADGTAVKSWTYDPIILDADEAVKLTHAVTGTVYVTIEYTEVTD